MNIAVCDDMVIERRIVCNAIDTLFSERGERVNIVEYSKGENLISDVEEGYEHFDLIFQDIYMHGITGMQTAQALRSLGCDAKIVFLTTTTEFAVESYDVEASGYLLKPLDVDKLKELLDRILVPNVRKRVALSFEGRYRYFYLDEIMWVESKNHKLEVHLIDGKVAQLWGKLNDVESTIDDEDFLRCHQSYLINMHHVEQFEDGFKMRDGSLIPVRVRSSKQIRELYHRWFSKKF